MTAAICQEAGDLAERYRLRGLDSIHLASFAEMVRGVGGAEARKYSELARLQFEGGVASYATVLQAEQQLFPAELNEVQFRASLLTAVVNVYKAMGGGWVFEAEQRTQ